MVKEGASTYSKARIRELTTVSDGLIGKMRRVLKERAAAVKNLPWSEAGRKVLKPSEEPDDSWRRHMIENFKDRLIKHFGKDLARHPDLFAEALAELDPDLPVQLCEHWPEAAETVTRYEEGGRSLEI